MLNKMLVAQYPTSGRHSDIRDESKPIAGYSSDDNISIDVRRQRRRVGGNDYSFHSASSTSAPGSAVPRNSTRLFTSQEAYSSLNDIAGASSTLRNWNSSVDDIITSGSEDELTGAVGQLSLNEDEQVRYHGKASGLYLLDNRERIDRRNEGRIWFVSLPSAYSASLIMYLYHRRFPKARVWPPLPSGSTALSGEDEFVSELPSTEVQEHLLDLYFVYVHPSFPIIHKQAFFDSYAAGYAFTRLPWHQI